MAADKGGKGQLAKGKTTGRPNNKTQNAVINNLIGEAVGSGRGNKNAEAHILQNTHSEERVATQGANYGTVATGGVRRVKMRQGAPATQNQQNIRGQSQVKERQQSRVRVRLQKRNGVTHQMSDNNSKDHKGSLENIVDAVVSI